MDLKRVGKHDEDDDGGFADSRTDGGPIYMNRSILVHRSLQVDTHTC